MSAAWEDEVVENSIWISELKNDDACFTMTQQALRRAEVPIDADWQWKYEQKSMREGGIETGQNQR